mgnify:CR=1 FL=1
MEIKETKPIIILIFAKSLNFLKPEMMPICVEVSELIIIRIESNLTVFSKWGTSSTLSAKYFEKINMMNATAPLKIKVILLAYLINHLSLCACSLFLV